MTKKDCDTCAYYDIFDAPACHTCITDVDGNATNYVRSEELEAPQDNHVEILNAIATIIEICEKYQNITNGCATMCPLRCPSEDQLEGIGVCAFESPMPPINWDLHEPDDEEDFPILLETDFYIDYEEEEYEITP